MEADPERSRAEQQLATRLYSTYDRYVQQTIRDALAISRRFAASDERNRLELIRGERLQLRANVDDQESQARRLALATVDELVDTDLLATVMNNLNSIRLVQDQTYASYTLYDKYQAASADWRQTYTRIVVPEVADGTYPSIEEAMKARRRFDQMALDIPTGYLSHRALSASVFRCGVGSAGAIGLVPRYIRPRLSVRELLSSEAREALDRRSNETAALSSALREPLRGARTARFSSLVRSWALKHKKDAVVEISAFSDYSVPARDGEAMGAFLSRFGASGPNADYYKERAKRYAVIAAPNGYSGMLLDPVVWNARIQDGALLLRNERAFLDRLCPTSTILSPSIERASGDGAAPTVKAVAEAFRQIDWKKIQSGCFSAGLLILGEPADNAPFLWLYDNDQLFRSMVDGAKEKDAKTLPGSKLPAASRDGLIRLMRLCSSSALFPPGGQKGPIPAISSDLSTCVRDATLSAERIELPDGTGYHLALISKTGHTIWESRLGPVKAK